MSGVALVPGKSQLSDSNGNPLAGGTVDVYLAGTTTRTNSWQDQALTSLNTNPIVLDGSGSCSMWLDGTTLYKIVVKNATGAVQPHLGGDNISGASGSVSFLSFLQSGTGAVPRNAQFKMRETASPEDFGAVADGVTADQAAILLAAATARTVRVPAGTHRITANTTVPAGVTFLFERGARISVASGVTVIWNAGIEAGHHQIFEFDDATSDIRATFPERYAQTQFRGPVKLAWFGAVGDARFGSDSPGVSAVPLGTDSSAAIRRAVRFVNSAAPTHADYYNTKAPILEGEPNAQYFVQGDNILGCQTTDLTSVLNSRWVNFHFEGNNCVFYWNPVAVDDAFLAELRHFDKPVYRNFNVRLCGFTGTRGRFLEYIQSGTNYSGFQMPLLDRVNVYGGTTGRTAGTPGLNNAIGEMFHIEDASNAYGSRADDIHIMDCQFWQFATFAYVNAREAVGWNVQNGQAFSNITGAIWFDWHSGSSKTINVDNFTMLLKGVDQTVFRSRQDIYVAGQEGRFFIERCRIESNATGDAFTLVDADCGTFHFRGLDANNGASAGVGAGAYLAKLDRSASLIMDDCTGLPNKVLMEALNPIGGAANAFVSSSDTRWQFCATRCGTYNGKSFDFRWHRTGVVEELTLRDATVTNSRWVRPIAVRDSLAQRVYLKDITLGNHEGGKIAERMGRRVGVYSGTSQQFVVMSGDLHTDFYLPGYVAIRALRVAAQTVSAGTVDAIRIKVGTALSFDVSLSTTNRTYTDVVTGTGKTAIVINTDPVTAEADYEVKAYGLLAGVVVTTVNVVGFIEIEYEGITDGNLWCSQTTPALV